MTTTNVKDLKKNFGLALNSAQIAFARKWASDHGVSMAAIASTAVNVLAQLPLNKRELIVESALREALGAQPSSSEAQLARRQAALENTVGTLCAEVQSLRAAIAAQGGTSSKGDTITNHISAGGDAVHRKTVTHHHHGRAGTNAVAKPISRPANDGTEN